jgi:hypothetical protein
MGTGVMVRSQRERPVEKMVMVGAVERLLLTRGYERAINEMKLWNRRGSWRHR